MTEEAPPPAAPADPDPEKVERERTLERALDEAQEIQVALAKRYPPAPAETPRQVTLAWSIAAAGLVGALLAAGVAVWDWPIPMRLPSNTGELGDTVGGFLSGTGSLAGFMLMFVAFKLQRDELREQRNVMNMQRVELAMQRQEIRESQRQLEASAKAQQELADSQKEAAEAQKRAADAQEQAAQSQRVTLELAELRSLQRDLEWALSYGSVFEGCTTANLSRTGSSPDAYKDFWQQRARSLVDNFKTLHALGVQDSLRRVRARVASVASDAQTGTQGRDDGFEYAQHRRVCDEALTFLSDIAAEAKRLGQITNVLDVPSPPWWRA